jgi:hypothetical protein
MLNWLMNNRIDSFEKRWGYDMSYARRLLAASPAALRAFFSAARLGNYRAGLPKEAWYAAKLRGTLHEDCGSCLQLVVQMALADDLEPRLVSAIVRGDTERLPAPVATVVSFCDATLNRETNADELRAEVVRLHGQHGLATIALSLAGARLYPTVKYALGLGHACSVLEVGRDRIIPSQPRHLAS